MRIILASVVAMVGATMPAAAEGVAGFAAIQVVVSLNQQSLRVFRDGEEVARTNISSGRRGYATPTGIFSILNKRRYHRSNQYSNSPMPWMQRLTWTGIALHESNDVPGYPASHGCVRMPAGFAEELFRMTGLGQHVIITGEEAAPRLIEHPLLPAQRQREPAVDHWRLRFEAGGTMDDMPQISTAAMLLPVVDRIGSRRNEPRELPIRVLITRRSHAEIVADVQGLLLRLGYYDGAIDGAAGARTFAAIRRFRRDNGLAASTAMDEQFTRLLHAKAGVSPPRNGRIHVRRNFEPLFEAPVAIREPQRALGTHLLVAAAGDADRSLRWLATTLENRLSKQQLAYYRIDTAAGDGDDPATVLHRIDLPPDVRARLAGLVGPGASIAISDTGLSGYTGWKTDFVVLTRTGDGRALAARR